MFQQIQRHYKDSDISKRKPEYYTQIQSPNRRSVSPHRTSQFQKISKPTAQDSINQINNYSIPEINESKISKNQQFKHENQFKFSHQIKKEEKKQISGVNENLKFTDPQRYKVLRQKSQLYHKLQMVTLGLPYNQNEIQSQLLSSNYVMPHYKSQKSKQIKQQQKRIKILTVQILDNQKQISRMSQVKKSIVQRVDRIRKIDQQIYQKLDEDRSQQIQNYLRMAKNSLAQGQSEQKIISLLKKALY